ncbi:hypothetical protein ACN47E_006471 [Coniothyrium glycines]
MSGFDFSHPAFGASYTKNPPPTWSFSGSPQRAPTSSLPDLASDNVSPFPGPVDSTVDSQANARLVFGNARVAPHRSFAMPTSRSARLRPPQANTSTAPAVVSSVTSAFGPPHNASALSGPVVPSGVSSLFGPQGPTSSLDPLEASGAPSLLNPFSTFSGFGGVPEKPAAATPANTAAASTLLPKGSQLMEQFTASLGSGIRIVSVTPGRAAARITSPRLLLEGNVKTLRVYCGLESLPMSWLDTLLDLTGYEDSPVQELHICIRSLLRPVLLDAEEDAKLAGYFTTMAQSWSDLNCNVKFYFWQKKAVEEGGAVENDKFSNFVERDLVKAIAALPEHGVELTDILGDESRAVVDSPAEVEELEDELL